MVIISKIVKSYLNVIFKKSLLLSMLLISFFIFGCSNAKTIEIKEEVKSPNGDYIAYLYSRFYKNNLYK